MGLGIKLRQSPSGKELIGTPELSFVRWDDTNKEWVIGTGGGGGEFVNLSNVFYVDGGTTVAEADQVGNIEAPWETLEQGITGGGRIFYCTPVAYGSFSETPGAGENFEFHCLGGTGIGQLPNFTVKAGDRVLLYGDWSVGAVTLEAGAELWVSPDSLTQIVSIAGTVSSVVRLFGVYQSSQCTIGDIDVGSLFAENWVFTNPIETTGGDGTEVNIELFNCRIAGASITSVGSITTDLTTINSIRISNVAVAVGDDGNLQVYDAPSVKEQYDTETIVEGINSFTVDFLGSRPGDTFTGSVVWQDTQPGLPDDAYLAVPVCHAADVVRVDIISTVDGGVSNSFILTVTRFPIADLPIPFSVPPP